MYITMDKHMSFNTLPNNKINMESSKRTHHRMKSKHLLIKGKYINKKELELYQNNINKLCNRVYRKIESKEKVKDFKEKYENLLNNGDGYLDMVLIMNYFQDFQIFNFIQFNLLLIDVNKKAVCVRLRNNIFLKLLITWYWNIGISDKQHNLIFVDKASINAHLEYFDSILESEGFVYGVSYEVELLLFSFLGFSKEAKLILALCGDYLNDLSNNCNITIDLWSLFNDLYCRKSFETLGINDIIFLRKSMDSIIQRKLCLCIEVLFSDLYYCLIGCEGRIWCSILANFTNEQVISIWKMFKLKLFLIKSNNKPRTLFIEYQSRLDFLQTKIREEANLLKVIASSDVLDESNKNTDYTFTLENLQLKMHLSLDSVESILNLIHIMFKIDKKALIIDFKPIFKEEKPNIKKEIFEICLENDEEMSIEILQIIPEEELIEESYMKMALLKKYFRLCSYLVRYPICKIYLNSPPPKSEFYCYLMQKNNFVQKQKKYNQFKIKNLLLLNYKKQKRTEDDISVQNNEANSENHDNYQINETNQKLNMTNFPSNSNDMIFKALKVNESKKVKLDKNEIKSETLEGLNNYPTTANGNLLLGTDIKEETYLMNKQISFERNTKNNIKTIKKETIYKIKSPNEELSKLSPELIRIKDVKQKQYDINVQMILIDQIPFGEYTYYSLALFSLIIDRYIIPEYIEKLCKNLIKLTRDEHEIIKNQRPLITLTLGAELINKIGSIFPKNQYKCSSVCEHLIRLSYCYQQSIKDEEMHKFYFVQQTDLLNRNTLEIISKNRFNILLNKKVDELINDNNWDISFFKFFRGLRIFSISFNEESYDELTSNTYFNSNTIFSFQFKSFIDNPAMKNLHNNTFAIIFAFIAALPLGGLVSFNHTQIFPNEKSFWNGIVSLYILSITILLEHIFFFIFVSKTKRFIYIYYYQLFTDLAIVSLSFGSYFIATKKNLTEEKNNLNSILYFCVLLLLMSFRALHKFQTTKIGNITRVIYDLKWNIFGFLCFFLGFNTLSSSFYFIFFSKTNNDFDTFYKSWMFLFNSTFGIYDYNFTTMNLFGSILLMINITMSNIGIFNLFVAIISNLFDKFTREKDSEDRLILIQMSQQQKWDETYGMLKLMPPPYNVITFILMPFLLLTRDENKQRYNLLFSKISFSFILLVNYILFAIIYIVLIPFAYIKIVLITIKECLNHKITATFLTFIWTIIKRFGDYFGFFWFDSYIYWVRGFDSLKVEAKKNKLNKVMTKNILFLREKLMAIKYKEHKRLITFTEFKRKILSYDQQKNLPKNKNQNIESGNLSAKSPPKNSSHTLGAITNNNAQTPSQLSFGISKRSSLIDKSGDYSKNSSIKDTPNNDNRDLLWLIDKITNEDKVINVDQALSLFTLREKLSDNLLERIKNYNIRVFERSMKKFLFFNHSHNAIYTYTRLQNIIFKLLIKFKLIYNCLPQNILDLIKPKLEEMNDHIDFSKKIYRKDCKLEENMSEYDDEGIMFETYQSNNPTNATSVSNHSNKNIESLLSK